MVFCKLAKIPAQYLHINRFHYDVHELTNGEQYRLKINLSKKLPTYSLTSTGSIITVRLTNSTTVKTGIDVYTTRESFVSLDTLFTADSSNPYLYVYLDTLGATGGTDVLVDDSYTFEVRIEKA